MNYKNHNILILSLILILLSSCRNGETTNDPVTVDTDPAISEVGAEEEAGEEDLRGTINGITELSRFAMELGAAEIPDLNIEEEVYTIFAPENNIFNSRYGESEEIIRKVNTGDLLAYHIVQGKVDMEEMLERTENNNEWVLKSLHGGDLTVIRENDQIFLKGGYGEKARIIQSLDASNGILYIIDDVLFPPEMNN